MPDEKFAVVILSNVDPMWMWPLARKLSDIYLRDHFAATLAEYAGTYEGSEFETRRARRRERRPGHQARQGGERAHPADPTDRFQGGSFGTVQFTRGANGKPNGLALDADSVAFRGVRFERK